MMLNRRRLAIGAGASIAATLGRTRSARHTVAQEADFPGSLLFVRSGEIWNWSDGDSERLISGGNLTSPRWSPGGDQILHVRLENSFSNLVLTYLSDMSSVDLTANEPSSDQIGSPDYVQNSIWVVDPSWSQSGRIGYASDSFTPYGTLSLWIMEYAGAYPQMFTNDPIEEDVTGVSMSSSGSYASYVTRTLDTNGVYVSYIAVRDLETWELRQLLWEPEGAFDPAMEPNGSRVACAIRRGGLTDIWLIDRLDAEPLQVTSGKNASRPVWYPDASFLAWYQVVDFKFEAWGCRINGRQVGEAQRLFGFDDIDSSAGMSWYW